MENKFIDYIDEVSNNLDYLKENLFEEIEQTINYIKNRDPLPAISLNTDTSILTAVANDMGYEKVFERQVQALAKKEDVLFAISTSGKSKNVIKAVITGKKKGIKIISLTGKNESELSSLSDVSIKVPSDKVNHIQEMHILIGHFICEMIEKDI